MVFAHLSDLHFHSRFKRDNIVKTRRLLKFACEEGFEHLVITGDVSDDAEEKDYLVLRKFLKNNDLLDSKKTSIIIGNHDIFGGVQTALDVVNFPAKCRTTSFKQQVKTFQEHFEELFEGVEYPVEGNPFPYLKIVGDYVLIAFNSIDVYSRLKNPFASNGKISKSSVKAVISALEQDKYKDKRRIVLSHHHFYKNRVSATSPQSAIWNKIENYTLKLRGKKKMFRFFKNCGVELVLHGHSHENRLYTRKGVQFVNGGACVENYNKSKSEIIFITYKGKDFEIEIKKLPIDINLPERKNPKDVYLPSIAS